MGGGGENGLGIAAAALAVVIVELPGRGRGPPRIAADFVDGGERHPDIKRRIFNALGHDGAGDLLEFSGEDFALGDRFGRKIVIWVSILGVLPFTLALPYANLFWTGALSIVIGLIIASAFSAIVVYGQELMPGNVGMVAGLFFGFAFGISGIGAAALGSLADATSVAGGELKVRIDVSAVYEVTK